MVVDSIGLFLLNAKEPSLYRVTVRGEVENEVETVMPEPRCEEPVPIPLEWCRVSLANVGDAVITINTEGRVTFLNSVAESLTGWKQDEAAGTLLEKVVSIVNHESREAIESPTVRALREGVNVGLPSRSLLIAKDGTERPIGPIADSATPIRNSRGEVAGAVFVFRDNSELYCRECALQVALEYADRIIATLREPFVVLGSDLRVRTANGSFYASFCVTPEDTQNRFIYELGNGQWDIPQLRTLLEEVLSNHHPVHNFEMELTSRQLAERACC